jgi:3-oxoacyl-[acyl-carrier-protein] synthase-3
MAEGDVTMSYAAITGWGTALPERVVSNAELASTIGVDDDWIVRRTGIRERRVVSPSERTSSLAVRAGRRALDRAGLSAADLDLVLVATTTPDRMIPGTAPIVQAELGASRAGAFDVNAACAGFIVGLMTASGLITSGAMSSCLVVGSEVLSRFVRLSDRNTSILFGDGAGAAVLQRSEEPGGLLATDLRSDGTGASLVEMPAGGSERPASADTIRGDEHFIFMNGREVFRAAVRTMSASSAETLRTAGLRSEDVDLFICHQANLRIVTECSGRLGIPEDRVFSNVDRYGNTSAASIAIALSEAADAGRLGPGSTVLLTAIGAGLVWGSCVIRWTAPVVRTDAESDHDALVGARP